MRRVETKEELLDHLTRTSAAYRKSYKFYGRLNKLLQITGGIVGSTAVLAIVPVIPVFVSVISIVPVIIGIITNATKLEDKKNKLKMLHQKFNSLISYVRSNKTIKEEDLDEDVFSKINEIHNDKDFIEPLEMYLKRYNLNGYEIEKPIPVIEPLIMKTISSKCESH